MRVEVPFHARHVLAMALQPAQMWIEPYLKESKLRTLENEWAVSLLDDGFPVACVGVIPVHEHRAALWAFLSQDVTAHNFTEIHVRARRYLAGLPFKRIEAEVDVDFAAGHRWAQLLGFRREAERMRAYHLDGHDCALYALVRD